MKERMKGVTEFQVDALFEAMDKDNSGTISFSELAVSLSVLSKGTPQEKLSVCINSYLHDIQVHF